MKVAIAATENSFEAKVDAHFARCSYFVFYDTETKATEFLPNNNKHLEEDAGPASVDFVYKRQVSKVISGDFGAKIKPLLDGYQIQMIVINNDNLKIKDILKMLDLKK